MMGTAFAESSDPLRFPALTQPVTDRSGGFEMSKSQPARHWRRTECGLDSHISRSGLRAIRTADEALWITDSKEGF